MAEHRHDREQMSEERLVMSPPCETTVDFPDRGQTNLARGSFSANDRKCFVQLPFTDEQLENHIHRGGPSLNQAVNRSKKQEVKRAAVRPFQPASGKRIGTAGRIKYDEDNQPTSESH